MVVYTIPALTAGSDLRPHEKEVVAAGIFVIIGMKQFHGVFRDHISLAFWPSIENANVATAGVLAKQARTSEIALFFT